MTEQHFYKRDAAMCDKPILYEGAGIEGIYLCNGYEVEEVDGEEYYWFDDIEGLHRAIALHLVQSRKALAPKEFRFIRNTMDKTQADVAAMMGVNVQTVARWEKGETPLPFAADTVLRSKFLAWLRPAEELRKFLSETPELRDEGDTVSDTPVLFVRDDEDDVWKEDSGARVLEGV